ncbi:hypothetical protein ACFL2Z_00040 [Candidatus Eisenbacteria bacterium]|uniref:Uncharacterized protein n=1 Tax=Eiseniibacteriota bacterium TaxID=2212470 RepID=A0ABV6YML0_UNCEI
MTRESKFRLDKIFKSHCRSRDNFLSRVFGIFNEEVVRCWCRCSQAKYEDLGRPVIRLQGERHPAVLDFTFKSRPDGRVYVGEMKCEMAFENYKYLVLSSPAKLDHHLKYSKKAFSRFLDIASGSTQYAVTVKGQEAAVSGSILVWGSITDDGRRAVMEKYKLADVLSLECMISDLLDWEDQAYIALIREKSQWCREMYDGLSDAAK